MSKIKTKNIKSVCFKASPHFQQIINHSYHITEKDEKSFITSMRYRIKNRIITVFSVYNNSTKKDTDATVVLGQWFVSVSALCAKQAPSCISVQHFQQSTTQPRCPWSPHSSFLFSCLSTCRQKISLPYTYFLVIFKSSSALNSSHHAVWHVNKSAHFRSSSKRIDVSQ